jgi:hypothetical protein
MSESILTWEKMLPVLLKSIKSDNKEVVSVAEQELATMAMVADLYNEVLEAAYESKKITNKDMLLTLVKSQKD